MPFYAVPKKNISIITIRNMMSSSIFIIVDINQFYIFFEQCNSIFMTKEDKSY